MLKKLELQEKTTQWVFILLCGFLIYASNEPKSVLARDLGVAKRQWRLATTETECRGRDNLRNSRSVFLIVE